MIWLFSASLVVVHVVCIVASTIEKKSENIQENIYNDKVSDQQNLVSMRKNWAPGLLFLERTALNLVLGFKSQETACAREKKSIILW